MCLRQRKELQQLKNIFHTDSLDLVQLIYILKVSSMCSIGIKQISILTLNTKILYVHLSIYTLHPNLVHSLFSRVISEIEVDTMTLFCDISALIRSSSKKKKKKKKTRVPLFHYI